MAQASLIPQDLMTGALLHFEQGVPIDDLNVRRENKDRLARVHHVYMQYLRNPMLDYTELLRALIRQGEKKYAGLPNEWAALQRDKRLLEFVLEHVNVSSRREDELMVRHAAKQAIRIGLETDNPNALTKGGKLLYDVAGLDKPEEEQQDISKVAFLPSVVVTNIEQIDPDKTYIDDEETRRIAAKYGAHIPEQRTMIEEQVATMEARAGAAELMAPEPPTPRNTFGTIMLAEDSEPNDESDDE